MDSIKLMMEEHQYILRMLAVVRKACLLIMKGQAIDYNDFEQMIDFIRNYSDVHHHGKESYYLMMVEHLGALAVDVKRSTIKHDWEDYMFMSLSLLWSVRNRATRKAV